jgi:hypothetical protein
MISIDGNNTGNVVPHPLSPHWRLILPDSDSIQARKAAMLHHGISLQFHSVKCNRIVAVESSLEYDRALLLEADPQVVLYEEYPFRFEHEVDGNVQTLIPSFIVLRTGGTLTVEEVTTRSMLVRLKFLERLTMEMMVLKRYGYRFALLTEEDIRVPGLILAKKEQKRNLIKTLTSANWADQGTADEVPTAGGNDWRRFKHRAIEHNRVARKVARTKPP